MHCNWKCIRHSSTKVCKTWFITLSVSSLNPRSEDSLDPLLFASRNKTDWWSCSSPCSYLNTLKSRYTYLAFNTIQTHILANQLLSNFNLSPGIVRWIVDFWGGISQCVRVNGTESDKLSSSTGSSQCCGMSPILSILYTDNCKSFQPGWHMTVYLLQRRIMLTAQWLLITVSFFNWTDDLFPISLLGADDALDDDGFLFITVFMLYVFYQIVCLLVYYISVCSMFYLPARQIPHGEK